MNFKGEMREKSGITLITLAVTIIILLILAGITIATITSDNGIIKNANDAKEQTEIAEEKEIVDRASLQAMGNNKRGNLVQDELQEQLDKITDSGKTEVSDNGEEFEVVFVDSNRYYNVDKDGNIIEEGKIVIDKSPGDMTKDENGNNLKGDESEPYEIWCIEDLVTFSIMNNGGNKELGINMFNFKDSYISLKRTLNFRSIYSYNDYKTTLYGDLNKDGQIDDLKTELTKEDTNCIGFTPIGNTTYSFSGAFLGNGFEINNIYENSKTIAGLFGEVDNATITDLGISGTLISNNGSAGGIVALNNNINTTVNIKNCYNKCNIIAKLVPQYNGAGGIVGGGYSTSSNLNIINCYNEGNITIEGTESYHPAVGAGGIVGNYRGGRILKIYNSYNSGKIISITDAAGILGGTWAEGTLNLVNCCNYGEILGSTNYNIINTTNTNRILTNCYYLQNNYNGKDSSFVTSYTNEEVDNIINKLNDYISSAIVQDTSWNKWIKGTNGPIFEKTK